MLLEDDETFEIEKIISHQSMGDNLKYKIKLKGSDDQEWVSANYLKIYQEKLLFEYDKENNINDTCNIHKISNKKDNIIAIKERAEESEFTEAFGCLALRFIEDFGIKMEVGIDDENSSVLTHSSNLLPGIEFGAAEFMVKNPIKPLDDVIAPGSISDAVNSESGFITDIDSLDTPESFVTIANDLNDEPEVIFCKKKNITIGKVKKATKPLSKFKSNPGETRTVKSIMLPSQIGNICEPIDKIFYNLPVITKIVSPAPAIDNSKLSPLTIFSLLAIIDSNNLKLLHRYSQFDRAVVEGILRNNPHLLVVAVNNNSISMVCALLELGADVDGKDLNGQRSLMVACDNENEAIIDILINNGASINRKINGKNDLLFRCIRTGKLTSLRLLLQLGIDFSSVENLVTDKSSKIGRIFEDHRMSLWSLLEEKMLIILGQHALINKVLMGPRVLSLFEIQGTQCDLTFLSNFSPIIENQCNVLFLITGLLHGSTMKLLIDDSNGVTSVLLNDVDQQSLTEGIFRRVTSFSPVKDEENRVIIKFAKDKCRKIRLVLVAVNVTILL